MVKIQPFISGKNNLMRPLSVLCLMLLSLLALPSFAAQSPDQPVGTIHLPYLYGDAGMVAMQAGSIVTVDWQDAPPKASLYLFLWKSSDENRLPFIMGMDTNDRDGVHINWKVGKYLGGKPLGLAFYADGTWLRSTLTALDYSSGEAPPAGMCSVSTSSMNGSPEVFDNPPGAGASYILGYVGSYAPVLERITDPDGFQWLKIDLTAAQLSPIDPNRPIPAVGWVYAHALKLYGDCHFLD